MPTSFSIILRNSAPNAGQIEDDRTRPESEKVLLSRLGQSHSKDITVFEVVNHHRDRALVRLASPALHPSLRLLSW